MQIAFADALEELSLGHGGEVRLEGLLVGIHVAAGGVVHTQRLDGAHQHDGAAAEILRPQLLAFTDVQHRQPVRRPIAQQRLAVRVAGHLERIQGLAAYGVRRHQPQGQRRIRADIQARRPLDGMGRQQRLAAAGRDADAGLRHRRRLLRQRPVRRIAQRLAEHRAAGVVESGM